MEVWKNVTGSHSATASLCSRFRCRSCVASPSCRHCHHANPCLVQSPSATQHDNLTSCRIRLPLLSAPLLLVLLFTQLLPQPATCQSSLLSVFTQSCFSSTFTNGSVQCTTTFPPQALSPNSVYQLTASAAPTDFSRPGQQLESLTINGYDVLRGAGGCVPVGVCSSSPPSLSTCFQGDVTARLSSTQPSVIIARASPAVTSPCSPCGASSQFPCSILILLYQLQLLQRPSVFPPPPLGSSSSPPPFLASLPLPPPPTLKFSSTPPSLSTSSSATFGWTALEPLTASLCATCAFTCQVDGSAAVSCGGSQYTTGILTDGAHTFNLSATSALGGLHSSIIYGWSIDTLGPVATLAVTPSLTGTSPVRLTITFSKPCVGGTGPVCTNTTCNILASAGLTVDPSTFQTLTPRLSFSVTLRVTAVASRRASVRLAGGVCWDGNGVAGLGSSAVVQIDVDPPVPVLSCQVAEQQTTFFSHPRTLLSTNHTPVSCLLSFSKPIVGVDLSRLQVVNGSASNITLLPNNTTLTLSLTPDSEGPLTLSLLPNAASDALGNGNTAAQPLHFVYDRSELRVRVVGPTDPIALASLYPVLLRFSKPVPNVTASTLSLTNGRVTCFTSADSGLGRYYEVTVAPLSVGTIQLSLPGGSVRDFAGNANSPSNTIRIRHQSPPPSEALASYIVTSVFGWTAVVSASVTLAMAVRESDPSASPGIRIVSNRPFRAVSTPVVGADPARNLLRCALHLQVMALTEHLAVANLPLFYRRLLKGLRWTYYYLPLPFEDRLFRGGTTHPLTLFPPQAPGVNSTADHQVCALSYLESLSGASPPSPSPSPTPVQSLPVRPSPQVTASEYFYAQQWGAAFTTNFPNLTASFHGFRQYVRILVYAGAVLLVAALAQCLVQFLCFTLRGQWLYGLLDPPRLHCFLLISAISGVAWGSTLLIVGSRQEGGHAAGLALGVVTLYLWPLGVVAAAVVAVWVVVVQEQLARFFVREMTETHKGGCAPLLWRVAGQKRLKGHWVTITPAERHILPRLGIFFEDYTVWGKGGSFGVLTDRLRALCSALDFLRMICVAVLLAAWSASDDSVVQPALLLGVTVATLVYLCVLQPFTERGIQVVEGVSLLCEAAIFICALLLKGGGPDMTESRAATLAILMLAFGCAAFVGQLVNQWVALAQQLSRIFYPSGNDERTPSEESGSEVYTDDDIVDEGEDMIDLSERAQDLDNDERR